MKNKQYKPTTFPGAIRRLQWKTAAGTGPGEKTDRGAKRTPVLLKKLRNLLQRTCHMWYNIQ